MDRKAILYSERHPFDVSPEGKKWLIETVDFDTGEFDLLAETDEEEEAKEAVSEWSRLMGLPLMTKKQLDTVGPKQRDIDDLWKELTNVQA